MGKMRQFQRDDITPQSQSVSLLAAKRASISQSSVIDTSAMSSNLYSSVKKTIAISNFEKAQKFKNVLQIKRFK